MNPVTPWDGKPISAPGCYAGLPIAEYHGGKACDGPSISSSGLRTIFSVSPLDYWFESPLRPKTPEELAEADKPHFVLGRAVHHLALGEADFAKHFLVRPDSYVDAKGVEKPWHSSSNTCKEWMEAANASGRGILTPTDMVHIRGMAGILPWQNGREDSGLKNSSLVEHSGLLDGLIEHSFAWKDAETGVWLRCRPDAIPLAGNVGGDLKTTTSVDYNDIEKTIASFRYDMQGALLRMAMKAVWGVDMESFALVFVEKTPPYTVAVVVLRDEDLAEAEQDLRIAIRTFARCLEKDRWPGKGGTQSDAVFISIPTWARTRNVARRAFLEKEISA
jgi:hypothetical protein